MLQQAADEGRSAERRQTADQGVAAHRSAAPGDPSPAPPRSYSVVKKAHTARNGNLKELRELIHKMGLDNPIHIAFLLILLLLVFGAKRLPEMGRSLGTGMRGFKESLSGEQLHAPLPVHHEAAAAAPAPVVAVAEPVVVPVAEPVGGPVREPSAPAA